MVQKTIHRTPIIRRHRRGIGVIRRRGRSTPLGRAEERHVEEEGSRTSQTPPSTIPKRLNTTPKRPCTTKRGATKRRPITPTPRPVTATRDHGEEASNVALLLGG
jgi:hypothetical protein